MPGKIERPGIGKPDRPTTLPGKIERPEIGKPDRPTTLPGKIDRPIVGRPDRPTTLPGVIDRPGNVIRPPGEIARPVFPHRPGDRPVIGGGRPGISTLPAYRPDWGWGNNVGRPGWNGTWHNGWNDRWNNHWHVHWHNHWYHNHVHWGFRRWYHGCWTNVNWYAPVTFGITGWGFSSLNGWGLGVPYYNPYFVAASSPVYDYSEPLVINNYVTAEGGDADSAADAEAQARAQTDPTVQLVDEARTLFGESQYRAALGKLDTALRRSPGDPVVHEFRALCLFALGDYDRAAAALNALLSSSPGMDWTTMSSLYQDGEEYARQLRRLESHCKSRPDDAAAAFVLAYHYLVLGETDAAVNALRVVVARQPRDSVARRMLDSLAPPEPPEANPPSDERPSAAPPKPSPPSPPTEEGDASAEGEETDLVGTWNAKGGETPITLSVDDQFRFVWTAKPPGKDPIEIQGNVETSSDTLILDAGDKGTMVGQVKSGGKDKFEFRLLGTPDTEAGLDFTRSR